MSDVASQLERDLAMLADAESYGRPAFRTWRSLEHTVVVGRSVRIEEEVRVDYCRESAIPIVRRPSGGRTVLIGPGTLQYTFALPYDLHPELRSIPGSKRYCNSILLAGLPRSDELEEHQSGDLILAGRKVGGLALKCKRRALLLHGTLLLAADIGIVESALQHPRHEPAYRGGRSHRDFLTNLGNVDEAFLNDTVTLHLGL